MIGNAGTLLTYGLGVVLNWRQLAGVLACLAVPYVLGLIFIVPNEEDNIQTDQDGSSTITKNIVVTLSDKGGCINNNVLGKPVQSIMDPSLSSQDSIYLQLKTPGDNRCEWFRILAVKVKEALCSRALWNGLVMMLFYQFGGYNVVTFYASTIIGSSSEV